MQDAAERAGTQRHGRLHEALLGAVPAGTRDRLAPGVRTAVAPTRRAGRSASIRRARVYDFLNGFGCHHLDLARFLMGEVAWVFATRGRRAEGDGPEWRPSELELARCRLGLARHVEARRGSGAARRRRRGPACSASTSGAVGTLQLNCLERLNERVVVTGPAAPSTVDGWRTVDRVPRRRDGPELWEPNDQLPGDAVDPRHVHGFAGEVRHFVECARDGSRPEVTIDDGIAAIRIEQALKRSARSANRWRCDGHETPTAYYERHRVACSTRPSSQT